MQQFSSYNSLKLALSLVNVWAYAQRANFNECFVKIGASIELDAMTTESVSTVQEKCNTCSSRYGEFVAEFTWIKYITSINTGTKYIMGINILEAEAGAIPDPSSMIFKKTQYI